jgi:hypothetical protein
MRYLAKTIADYIFEASKKPGTYKFIMPSYPSGVLVDIGNILEKSFGNVLELKVKFLYGIAYRLGQRWKSTAAKWTVYYSSRELLHRKRQASKQVADRIWASGTRCNQKRC